MKILDIIAASASSSNSYPLDVVPDAAFAYCMKKLRGAYTGFAFKARRSSDDATTDVSFDNVGVVSNNSSVSAGGTFGTWRGVSTIFIHTLYDQSTFTNNLTQITNANQPIFTDAHYLGNPSIRIQSPQVMGGTNTTLQSPVNSCSLFTRIQLDNGAATNTVFNGGNSISGASGLFFTLSNRFRFLYRSPYAILGGDDILSVTGNVPSNSYFTSMGVRNSAANNQIVYRNNVAVGTLSSLTQPALPATNMAISLGGNFGGNAMAGYIFAIISYPYAITSAQRTYLQANI